MLTLYMFGDIAAFLEVFGLQREDVLDITNVKIEVSTYR